MWANRNPTTRPDEVEFVEAQCKICGYWFDVNPNLLMTDEDTEEWNFTCNGCAAGGRR